MQALAPAPEYVDVPQLVQIDPAVAPVVIENVPAEQLVDVIRKTLSQSE